MKLNDDVRDATRNPGNPQAADHDGFRNRNSLTALIAVIPRHHGHDQEPDGEQGKRNAGNLGRPAELVTDEIDHLQHGPGAGEVAQAPLNDFPIEQPADEFGHRDRPVEVASNVAAGQTGVQEPDRNGTCEPCYLNSSAVVMAGHLWSDPR